MMSHTKAHTSSSTAMLSNTRPYHFDVSGSSKEKKPQVICEVCGYKGHTKKTCYRIVGYPPVWKGKKKGVPAQYNPIYVGNSNSYANLANVIPTDI